MAPFGEIASDDQIDDSYRTATTYHQNTGTSFAKAAATNTYYTICQVTVGAGTWLLIGRLSLGYSSNGDVYGTARLITGGNTVIATSYYYGSERNTNTSYAAESGEPTTLLGTVTVGSTTTVSSQVSFATGSSGPAYSGNSSTYGDSKLIAIRLDGTSTTLGEVTSSETALGIPERASSTHTLSSDVTPTTSLTTLSGMTYTSDRSHTVLALANGQYQHSVIESFGRVALTRNGTVIANGFANDHKTSVANACRNTIGIHALATLSSGDTVALATATQSASASNMFLSETSMVVVSVGGSKTLGELGSSSKIDESLFAPVTLNRTTDGNLTPTVAGTYLAIANARFDHSSINSNSQLALSRNGTVVDRSRSSCGATIDNSLRTTPYVFDIASYNGTTDYATMACSGTGTWSVANQNFSMIRL